MAKESMPYKIKRQGVEIEISQLESGTYTLTTGNRTLLADDISARTLNKLLTYKQGEQQCHMN